MGAATSASVKPTCAPQPGASGKRRASASSTGSSDKSTSSGLATSSTGPPCEADGLDGLLVQNRQWAAERITEDPAYFRRLQNIQAPQWLWIGCADSRVPVFVQRNVGNQATHTDMNVMACVEYAVKGLKVQNIICCGHYGCNAVKAALQMPSKTQGIVNCWISDIRECRNQHHDELHMLPPTQRVDRLCELNVIRQCFHLCTSPVVQNAWDQGQEINVYGMIYGLRDGLMHKLVGPLTSANASSEMFEYEHSNGNSKLGSQKIAWGSVPVKEFCMSCDVDHGVECRCEGARVSGPVQDAAYRTQNLASKIAAHTGWHLPSRRSVELPIIY